MRNFLVLKKDCQLLHHFGHFLLFLLQEKTAANIERGPYLLKEG